MPFSPRPGDYHAFFAGISATPRGALKGQGGLWIGSGVCLRLRPTVLCVLAGFPSLSFPEKLVRTPEVRALILFCILFNPRLRKKPHTHPSAGAGGVSWDCILISGPLSFPGLHQISNGFLHAARLRPARILNSTLRFVSLVFNAGRVYTLPREFERKFACDFEQLTHSKLSPRALFLLSALRECCVPGLRFSKRSRDFYVY